MGPMMADLHLTVAEPFAESVDPEEARWIDTSEPCYLVMARLDAAGAAAAA